MDTLHARVVLAVADGLSGRQAAFKLGTHPVIASAIVRSFLRGGLRAVAAMEPMARILKRTGHDPSSLEKLGIFLRTATGPVQKSLSGKLFLCAVEDFAHGKRLATTIGDHLAAHLECEPREDKLPPYP